MEGLLSSPGWGWVTSAPNMMVGLSVTKGMHLDTASASTVFLPPTFESKSVGFNNRKNATKIKAESMKTNLDIYLQSKICQYLFVHLKNLLCAAALRNYPKVYFADTLQITWYEQRIFDSNYMLNSTGIIKVAYRVLSLYTIKRTIVVRKYSYKQIKFLALWSKHVHCIMEPGFQGSLHLSRICIHRWKNRLQGKVLQPH